MLRKSRLQVRTRHARKVAAARDAIQIADAIAERAGQPVIAEPVPVPPVATTMPVSPPVRLPDRFAVALVSSQRGVLMTRRVPTWDNAFAAAHGLLDEAVGRAWHHGDVVSVRIEAVGCAANEANERGGISPLTLRSKSTGQKIF
jgi:hypothetical protein